MNTAMTLKAQSRPAAHRNSMLMFAIVLAITCTIAALGVHAATNEGTALQAAYDSLNQMANGYGKQILTLMGFVIAAIGYIATNASGVVMKFIGYAIFLGAALGAAVTLVGATI